EIGRRTLAPHRITAHPLIVVVHIRPELCTASFWVLARSSEWRLGSMNGHHTATSSDAAVRDGDLQLKIMWRMLLAVYGPPDTPHGRQFGRDYAEATSLASFR